MATNFTSPIGRLVQGDCYVAQPRRDATGKPKVGADGKPETQFFVALAIPKNDPAWPAFKALLDNEARTAWPQYFNAAGQCTNPTFADKVTDGDGVDQKGQPHSAKEGFAGHWVVKFGSGFAPKAYRWDAAQGWVETAPGEIKLGDYIKVSGSISSNQSAQSPGMYLNLNMIAFDHEGPRIVLGPTPDQAFGAPGTAGHVGPLPGATPATGAPTPTTGPTAPSAASPSSVAPAPPYTGFMQPPPPPSGPIMLPAAGGVSYQQYRDAGWTDDQLVQHGYMQRPA